MFTHIVLKVKSSQWWAFISIGQHAEETYEIEKKDQPTNMSTCLSCLPMRIFKIVLQWSVCENCFIGNRNEKAVTGRKQLTTVILYIGLFVKRKKALIRGSRKVQFFNNSSKLHWTSTDLFCFWPEKQGIGSMIFSNKRSMIAKRYADMMSCISILLIPSNFWLAFLKALFCGFYYRQVWNKLPPPGLPRPSIFEHVSLL